MRLPEAKAFYIESLHLRRLSLNTIKGEEECLKNFFGYCEGIKLDDVRNATLETLLGFKKWMASRRKVNGEPLSINYQNKNVRVAAHMFLYLFEQEYLLSDITRHMPQLKRPKQLPRDILNREQVTKLLRQPNLSKPIGFRDRTALELLYSCALRGGELCKLTPYDVDFKERTIRVLQGKGKKDRFVPIGKVAFQYLQEYTKTVYPVLQKKRPGLTLFLIGLSGFRKRFKDYCYQVGLPDTLTVHCLRHTCATELLRGGASVRHVQELLGHSCITTTQVYTHVAINDLQKAHKSSAPSERRTKDAFISFNRDTARWRQDKPKRRKRK